MAISMKRIIDGVTYDTGTATLVAESVRWGEPQSKYDGRERLSRLYVTPAGRYFELGKFRGRNVTYALTIRPVDAGDVSDFKDRDGRKLWPVNPDAYPDAGETDPAEKIFIRVPKVLKRQIEAQAVDDGLSVDTWMARIAQRALESHPDV